MAPVETDRVAGTGVISHPGSGVPALSVVAPLFNEEDNVLPLVEAVRRALRDHPSWELVLVDDGSADRTAALVREAAAADPRVRLVQLARNFGQTHAMQAGFDAARGDVLVGMDGDLQNDPEEIPRLEAKLAEGYDLVAGYRENRQDKLVSRKVPSWVANRLIRWITRVDIRDNGCSLKAYRRETVERMHLYSDLHRFLPALAAATSGARITEIPVRHHARRHGTSKYGAGRIFRVLADLLTLTMISWFREHPLRMFGFGAAGAFALTALFAVAAVLTVHQRDFESDYFLVLPGCTLVCLLLAVYLLMLGLIGEVALRMARREESEEPPLAVEPVL
jgi:glycosyltransferase involved in cell wall biosynthesis